jgi:hypothetical protein
MKPIEIGIICRKLTAVSIRSGSSLILLTKKLAPNHKTIAAISPQIIQAV